MNKKLVKIGEAAKLLGTTPDTLRKCESTLWINSQIIVIDDNAMFPKFYKKDRKFK